MDDDEERDAPPTVIASVAAGVAVLPFLAIYAILFISRGTVRPVIPPDVGTSKGDELVAGLVALALFVLGALAAFWFLDGRRRWLFAVCQFALLVTCGYFLTDSDSGPAAVPVVLLVAALLALVLAFAPPSWAHVRCGMPSWLRRPGGTHRPAGAPETPV